MLLRKQNLYVLFLIEYAALVAAQCMRGFERRNGVCVACAAGKFKDDMSIGPCRECRTGTFSTTIGATSESTCRECNTTAGLTTSNAGATSCICDAGWTGPSGRAPCRKCPSGEVSNGFGMTQCVSCNEGQHPDRYGKFCEQCPDAMVQPPGGTTWDTCVCMAGFFGSLTEGCFNCYPGYYQNELGATSCKECPAGTSSYYAAETCTGCPDNSFFRVSSNACFCNAGYGGPRGGPCVACDPGKYLFDTRGDSDWDCFLCGVCTDCATGKYQDQSGASACKECPAGTYSYYAAETCSVCSENMWLNIDMNNCYCNKGYIGPPGGPCVACAPGTYSPQTGRTVAEGCDFCSAGYYQDQSGASACLFCAVDTYSSQGAAGCVACNANLVAFAPSTCTNRVQNMSTCGILNGLWTNASPTEVAEFDERMKVQLEATWKSMEVNNQVLNTTICISRMKDFFCAYHAGLDQLFSPCFAGGEALKPCFEVCAAFGACVSGPNMCATASPPPGSACLGPYSLPQTSNAARDACVCRPGNTRVDGVCVDCVAGTYKMDSGDEACTSCESNSISPAGSTSIDACVCGIGYGIRV